jgi:phosphoglycolate phosphatase
MKARFSEALGPETLFLFDIDGTLLTGASPAHRQAICDACQEVFGITLAPEAIRDTAGRTDMAIAYSVLASLGINCETVTPLLPDFFAAMAHAYARYEPADLRYALTPFAAETLAYLAARQVCMGLVTGNLEPIAWAKLRAAAIASYFCCGAFGNESTTRAPLARLARERAETLTGRHFAAQTTFIIGDTPHDIACGVTCGYRTIGVATGRYHTHADLLACSPDYLLPHLGALAGLP